MKFHGVGGQQAFAWIAFTVLIVLSLVQPLTWMLVWFYPIPLIVFTVTNRLWMPATLAGAYAVCLMLAGYGWSAWVFGLAIFFVGWVMGDSLKNRESPFAPLITGTMVFVMLELILFALLHWFGYNFSDIIVRSLESQAANPRLAGVSPSVWSHQVRQFADQVRLLLPGGMCIWGLVAATINLLVARRLLSNVALPTGPLAPLPLLSAWRLPYTVAVVYMVTIVCVLLGLFQRVAWAWQFVNSGALITGFLVGVQGLSYLWRKLAKSPGRWLILLILLSAGVASRVVGQVYILVGLFDMLSSARRKDV